MLLILGIPIWLNPGRRTEKSIMIGELTTPIRATLRFTDPQMPNRFNLHIMKYVDESNHELRYTLKDISTGRVYLAVVC
jgi:hypothetical protein